MTTLKASTSSSNRWMSPFMLAIVLFVVLGILAGIVLGTWFVTKAQSTDLGVPASIENFAENTGIDNRQLQSNTAAALIPVTAEQSELVAEYAIFWLDDGDSATPMLKSIWLAKLFSEPNKVELIGIEPDQAALELLINNPDAIDSAVAAYLSETLTGYVVVDNGDITSFVDAFAPLEIGEAKIDGSNLEDFLALSPEERQTVMLQAAVLQAIAADWTQGEVPQLSLDILSIYHTLSVTELNELKEVIKLSNMDRFDIYVAPKSN